MYTVLNENINQNTISVIWKIIYFRTVFFLGPLKSSQLKYLSYDWERFTLLEVFNNFNGTMNWPQTQKTSTTENKILCRILSVLYIWIYKLMSKLIRMLFILLIVNDRYLMTNEIIEKWVCHDSCNEFILYITN